MELKEFFPGAEEEFIMPPSWRAGAEVGGRPGEIRLLDWIGGGACGPE